ncbi:glycosyltransferase [Aeromonas allosaccharophila]|uniref:Glycosyltransferase n=1 Tax=Aeromonas allosaccharophila TaxID=656 RepID=A0ABZ0FE35_9GAMM|nr:glycosyltransferase [Aeromonas allosaccharophila]WOE67787.1 glycosyltransferase [Aeromonas allosaccharophila]
MAFKIMLGGTLTHNVKKKCIGIFCPDYKVWMGGVNYYLRLCQALSKMEEDIKLVVFLPRGTLVDIKSQFEQCHNVSVVDIHSTKQSISSLLLSLILGVDYKFERLAAKHELDVVIENASFYGWRTKLQCIGWVPDLQHIFLPQYFSLFSRVKRNIGFYLQSLLRDRIIVSSQDTKNTFVDFYRVGNPEKIGVVRFALESMINAHPDVEIKSKYGLRDKYVFMPNQYWPHKNHRIVVEALSILRRNDSAPVQIVSVGSTSSDTYQSVAELINERNVTDDYKVLGFVSESDMRQLFINSVAVLNPSLFEGWSSSVEEAKSFNKMMILSDIPVHHEQASDNVCFFKANSAGDLSRYLIEDEFPRVINSPKVDFFGRFIDDLKTVLK